MRHTANLTANGRRQTFGGVYSGAMQKSARSQALFASFALSLLLLAILFIAGFPNLGPLVGNDSLLLLEHAHIMNFSHPESLYNGFFPFGYPVLTHSLTVLMTAQAVNALLLLLNILAAGTCAFLIAKISKGRVRNWLIPAGSIASFIYPEFLRAVLTSMPDFLMMTLILLGFAHLIEPSDKNFRLAAIYMGLGYLLRTHALLIGIGVVCSLMILDEGGWGSGFKRAANFGFVFLLFVIFQGIFNLYSHHGFFESAQSFNLWKSMYGINWLRLPQKVPNLLTLITSDPVLFIVTWLRGLLHYLPALLLLVLGLVRLRKKNDQPLRIVCTACLIYILLICVGDSYHALLPIIPVLCIIVFELLSYVLFPSKTPGYRLLVLCLLLVIAVGGVVGALNIRGRVSEYQELGLELNIRDNHDAKKIYTDDLSLYFPAGDNAIPRTCAGWNQYALAGYGLDRSAGFPADSSYDFIHSLVANECTYVVIRKIPFNPFLANVCGSGRVRVGSDSVQFEPAPSATSYRIYRFVNLGSR
jgi:hypothetical protein